jgi:hypothetical protein
LVALARMWSITLENPGHPIIADTSRTIFKLFIQVYDDHFSKQYGFWRPYVEQVIYCYLECGDLHNGFARFKEIADYRW